jgi:hypothetical protein
MPLHRQENSAVNRINIYDILVCLIACICVLYEKGICFGLDANYVGVQAGFQYCSAMFQQ